MTIEVEHINARDPQPFPGTRKTIRRQLARAHTRNRLGARSIDVCQRCGWEVDWGKPCPCEELCPECFAKVSDFEPHEGGCSHDEPYYEDEDDYLDDGQEMTARLQREDEAQMDGQDEDIPW